jgi:hypothetical protein
MNPTIALYQGFPDFHYELIMHALEFCIQRNYPFSIFVHHNSISVQYKNALEQVFKRSLPWHHVNEFAPIDFDAIFLLTDDDPTFHEWDPCIHKMICIDHYYVIRNPRPFAARIATRVFQNRPEAPHVLSICDAISFEDKMEIVQASNKIHIMTLGSGTIPPDKTVLQELFGNDFEQKIELHIVTRTFALAPTAPQEFADCPNIHLYHNATPDECFDLLRKCTFVLCYALHEHHTWHSVSGAMFMAYMFGCKMIMPDEWQDVFQLDSAVTYGGRHVPNRFVDVYSNETQSLVDVFEERTALINKRNALFDAAVTQCLQNA